MTIYEVITHLHQKVKEAIEAQCDCVVTSIKATSTTHYAPTKAVKAVYIMCDAAMTFRVEARRDLTEMTIDAVLDSNGTLLVRQVRESLSIL